MFYSIFTECKDSFALYPGSIAAIRKGKKSTGWYDGAMSSGEKLVNPAQNSSDADDVVDCLVFQDKINALKSFKRFPIARMETFNTIEEARQFALLKPDCMQTEEDKPTRYISDFLEPSYRQVILMRKCVIDGEYEKVKTLIRANPKTLITSSGQPTNLIMSFDYNVIHICAQYNRPKIAELILNTICSRRFVNLFLKDEMKPLEYVEVSKNILNMFLNMPDKIRGETPLHIAAKYGSMEVVKVLTSFSLCQSYTNKDSHQPVDIICEYAPNSTEDCFRNIKQLLLERCLGPQDLSISLNSEDTERALHFYSYRKQSALSFESPLSPIDYRLLAVDEDKPVKARRSLFRTNSEEDLTEPNAEVKQFDSVDNLEMVEFSSTPLKHSEYPSLYLTAPLLTEHYQTSQDNLSMSLNYDDENGFLNRETHLSGHKKQISRLSLESPLLLIDTCLPQHKEKSVNARRSLFITSEEENSIEQSDQVLIEPNADVKQFDDGVNLKMFNLSLIPSKHSEDTSSFDKLPLPTTSALDRSPGIILNINFDISDKSQESKNSLYPNPWLKIELSLSENIKLITTLLARKLHIMSSSNELLIFQIKRLHALICKFQKDENFNRIAFEKIHSRVGSLLVTSIAKSHNIVDIIANVESIISEVLTECPKYIKGIINCISGYFLKKLKESVEKHSNSLKNDKLGAFVVWMEEESCNCQWQNNMEILTESFPESRNVRKRLNEDITEDFTKLPILDDEPNKNDIQDNVMKKLKVHNPRSIADSSCNTQKSKNSDQIFRNILNDISAKNNLGVDKGKKSLQDVDYRQQLSEIKNIFKPVKGEDKILLETIDGNVKDDEVIKTKATLPISFEVLKRSKSTPLNIPISGKLLVLKTPEKKSKGLFSMYRHKHDSDDEDNLLTETKNVSPVSLKTVDATNKTKSLISKTNLIKTPLILITTESKKRELFTKYRQQRESDDEVTILGSNESELSD